MRWLAIATVAIAPWASADILVPTSQFRWAQSALNGAEERMDSHDFARFIAVARLEDGSQFAESSQDTTIGGSSIFGTLGGHITPGASATMTQCLVEFDMLVDGSFIVEANTPYQGGFVLYVWDAEGVTIFDRPFSSMDGDYFYEDVMPAGHYTLRVAAFTFGDGTGYLDVGGWFSLTLVPGPGVGVAAGGVVASVLVRRRRPATIRP